MVSNLDVLFKIFVNIENPHISEETYQSIFVQIFNRLIQNFHHYLLKDSLNRLHYNTR